MGKQRLTAGCNLGQLQWELALACANTTHLLLFLFILCFKMEPPRSSSSGEFGESSPQMAFSAGSHRHSMMGSSGGAWWGGGRLFIFIYIYLYRSPTI